MKLTILERIRLPHLYPRSGNLIELRLVDDINRKIIIDQKTIKEIEFKATDTGYSWKNEKDVDIKFTDMELDFLRERIKILDSEKKLETELLKFYEKISENKTDKTTDKQ